MTHRATIFLLSLALAISPLLGGIASASTVDTDLDDVWFPVADNGTPQVTFFFVYSETCGHCARAEPFIDQMESDYEWLVVERVSAQSATDDEIDLVLGLAAEIDEEILGFPTYLYCRTMEVGFDTAETTGADLAQELEACHEALVTASAPQADEATPVPEETPADDTMHLPVLGDIDAGDVSLPLFTIAVAGLDAFNPCAFFVLLFLLSLLVHARSRWRMAVVGGVFVVMSGFMYFAFMSAWLNLFLVTGQLRWVTTVAGLIALAIAAFNIKDYLFPHSSGSLSIPDDAKPGLFARMRRLATGDSMPTVLAGTVALAAVANSYELLCTAGFPMVFTRVLTLNDLPTSSYYAYLGFYNVIYIIPLLVIVAVFVWTLGSRKLSESEGRFLKLMSGTMMLGLGAMLVLSPHLLENMLAAAVILGGSILVSVIWVAVDRRRSQPKQSPDRMSGRGA